MEWLRKLVRYRYCMMLLLVCGPLPERITAQEMPQYTTKTIPGSKAAFSADTARVSKLIAQGNAIKAMDADSAIRLFEMANRLAVRNGLDAKNVRSLALMIGCYNRKGDFDQSRILIDSAFGIAGRVTDPEVIGYLYLVTATRYHQLSDYAKAFIDYNKGVEIAKSGKLHDPSVLAALYNNFGSLMVTLKEWTYARKYLTEARKYTLLKQPADSATLAYIIMNIGITYGDANADVAIRYFKEVLDMHRENKDIYITHYLFINLYNAYMNKRDYDSAVIYLKKAEQFATTNPTRELMEHRKGQLLLATKNYARAIVHLNAAEALALKSKSETNLVGIYNDIARWNEEMGYYKQALTYQQKTAALKEQQQSGERNKIMDLLLGYQAAENEKELAKSQLQLRLKEDALRTKNLWIAIVSGSSLLLLLLLGLLYRNYRHRQRLQQERLQTFAQQQEIEKLKAAAEGEEKERARIAHDLHDGVMVQFANVKMKLNVLPSLYPAFAGSGHFTELMKQFDRATSELRHTSHNLMPDVLLEDGIAPATFYFCKAIQETSGLTVSFLLVGEPLPRLLPEFEIMIYRIIQELVQNIMKHARATKALVQLHYSDHLLSVTVEDNGRGFAPETYTEGFGIKSIRQRVRMLKGNFNMESINRTGTTSYMEVDVRLLMADAQQNGIPASL